MLLSDVIFNMVIVDKETGYEAVNKIHDSTFHILMIQSMEKCHNNLYLAKFNQFLKIFFTQATNQTLLNSFVKTNLFTDITDFMKNHVQGWNYVSTIKDSYIWFFKDLIIDIEGVKNRKNCEQFTFELDRSTSWKAILHMYKSDFKVEYETERNAKQHKRNTSEALTSKNNSTKFHSKNPSIEMRNVLGQNPKDESSLGLSRANQSKPSN